MSADCGLPGTPRPSRSWKSESKRLSRNEDDPRNRNELCELEGPRVKDLSRVLPLIESGFRSIHVLVIGDVMLDRYVWGSVDRISPEAPVPVLRSVNTTRVPGGAANVCM